MKIETLITRLQKIAEKHGNCTINVKGISHYTYGRLLPGKKSRDKYGIRLHV